MAEVKKIPVKDIKVGDHALRASEDDEGIDELAASIRRVGVLVPLVCRDESGVLCLVAGHRRLKAAERVGLEAVPVVVGDYSDAKAKEVSFAENMFRADLTAVEIAAGMKDVLENGVMEIDELAKAVHRSTNWVGRMIALLAWPADVLAAIHAGWLSVSAANNLALITDDVYRDFLLRNAFDSGATARTTAAWLQAWRSFQPPEAALQTEPGTAGSPPQPAVPQAPCICCGNVFRTDELSHVPACVSCIRVIREVGTSR
ncbi:Nucleoid occlusion protein [subsurface metagenome]